eukprot:CAMPEP_0177265590 /NCGR_PEP_ID=MMETSP0367-20130122/62205_1 /TAXON_ID=447022 ORGANISM="Scrippsiella hangoei-like, Strain SHHI-4" /NCGR_SAMPLE_ID=MMETSP0367 /ASSEMBLY_ACC=CAM_ASM_000362 /LENGTH=88 /DNA_ID=CAMNT_0018720849 /DNA_START=21 /DNA_END=284 /DNA_ORIENTATION=-
MIWSHMEPRKKERKPGVRIKPPDKDRVYQLVETILPRKKQKQAPPGAPEQVVLWSREGQIFLAQQHGEWHNLRIHARFLEFAQPGKDE